MTASSPRLPASAPGLGISIRGLRLRIRKQLGPWPDRRRFNRCNRRNVEQYVRLQRRPEGRKAHSRSCYGNNRFSITNPRSEKLRAPVFIQAPQIVSVSTRRSGLLFLPFEADNPAATPIIRSLVLLGAGSDAGDKSHERVLLWSAFSVRGARLGASSWPAGANTR